MAEANFGRVWEYRFYDGDGLITFDRYPDGVPGKLDGYEQAMRAVELFRDEHHTKVTRVERSSGTGEWENVPIV